MQQTSTIKIADLIVEDRQRQDEGNIKELADSIQSIGLIQPIVINQNKRLIAGGRRLAAMKSLGWESTPYVFVETLGEDDLTIMELEENIQRKEMTWQERTLGVLKVHSLKTKQKWTSNREDWTMAQTGQMLGMSTASVSYTLQVARALADPNSGVHVADSFTEAVRLLAREAEDAAEAVLADRLKAKMASCEDKPTSIALPERPPEEIDESDPTPLANSVIPLSKMLLHGNCLDLLADMDEGCVDHCISDPPYGIDMTMLDQENSGMDVSRVAKEHDVEANLELLEKVVPLLYHVIAPTGYCALWCDAMHFRFLHDCMTKAGFRVQRWPITWHKTSPCMNQSAYKNYTKTTEIAILGAKGNASLTAPSSTCLIAAPAYRGNSNPFAKPIDVWAFLIKHLTRQGQTILDPFCGEGSAISAFVSYWRSFLGIEINEQHFNICLNRTRDQLDVVYRKPRYA